MTPSKPSRTRLRDFLADVNATIGTLPLVHTSDAFRIRDIADSGRLEPTPCGVFEEDLLYLFLGRPAYRTRQQTNDNIKFDLPVVIVLKPESPLPPPKRVFPFDTGAFAARLYHRYFHKDNLLADFALEPSIVGGQRLISFFYTDNKQYFIGATRKNVEIPFSQFELQGLHELARAPADPTLDVPVPPDERSSSVELQFDQPISLAGNVLAIVLPEQYMEDLAIIEEIKSMDPLHIETYPVINKMGSKEIAGMVYKIVQDVYAKSGYF